MPKCQSNCESKKEVIIVSGNMSPMDDNISIQKFKEKAKIFV
jgi:hypothetical protein